jgi:cytochrome b6-f complex iron-sulfur subunit
MTQNHLATSETELVTPVQRRDFLKLAWGAMAGLVTAELGLVTMAYLQPRLAEGEFGSLIVAGNVDDFPPGSVTHIVNGRFYLSRLPDGGFLAIYQRCTHLGCNVPWDQAANAFVCPCHSSQFTADGSLVNPPATRPLDLFPVVIESGEIEVDTARPVTRQSFDPSQVVYP